MTPHPLPSRRRLALLAVVPVLLVPALAACGGSSSGASGTSGSSADSAVSSEAGGSRADLSQSAPATGAAADTAEAVAPIQRSVISTGEVRLTSKDVAGVRSDLDRLLDRYDGFVADERTDTDREGRASSSTLTLRLPSRDFDALMKALEGLGRLTSSNRDAEDVSTQVIDVQQRIRAQEVGLRRLEVLMGRSSSLPNLLAVEREVTRRQADLDSLKSQQKYLTDQTSLATVTLSVTRRTAPPAVHHAGFLGGLQSGWEALVDVVRGASVVLGALLPFAAVALVLFFPVRLLVRRLRKVRVTPTAAT